jgi:hypothetical protein
MQGFALPAGLFDLHLLRDTLIPCFLVAFLGRLCLPENGLFVPPWC